MIVIINFNLFNLYIFKFNLMYYYGGILRNKYYKLVDLKISSLGMDIFFCIKFGLGLLWFYLFFNYIVCDL